MRKISTRLIRNSIPDLISYVREKAWYAKCRKNIGISVITYKIIKILKKFKKYSKLKSSFGTTWQSSTQVLTRLVPAHAEAKLKAEVLTKSSEDFCREPRSTPGAESFKIPSI